MEEDTLYMHLKLGEGYATAAIRPTHRGTYEVGVAFCDLRFPRWAQSINTPEASNARTA